MPLLCINCNGSTTQGNNDVVGSSTISDTLPAELEIAESGVADNSDDGYVALPIGHYTAVSLNCHLDVELIYSPGNSGIVQVYGTHLARAAELFTLRNDVLNIDYPFTNAGNGVMIGNGNINGNGSNSNVVINGVHYGNNYNNDYDKCLYKRGEVAIYVNDSNQYLIVTGNSKNYIGNNIGNINCNVNGHSININGGVITVDGRRATEADMPENGGAELEDDEVTEPVPVVDKVKVYYSRLNALTISGSGDIEGDLTQGVSALRLLINGSGDIEVDVNATDIDATINGSGSIEIDGKTKSLNLNIIGSGSIDVKGLSYDKINSNVLGSGRIKQ